MGFSKRTLQRDLKEIRDIFGITIEYSKAEKGYFLQQSESENLNFQRMLESFEIFNSLNLANDLTPFVHLEKRRPQGTENLYGVLHALKNKVKIKFSYQKFWDDKPTQRTAETYALKEFKNRWYILAKEDYSTIIKTFALDRLSNLEITNEHFEFPKNFNIEETFRYCFGIIGANGEAPQDIILSFNAEQGKYIKTLPLHHTQEILKDTNEELQIKLRLCITHDLIMELLSYSDEMKVLQPKILADKIKRMHQNACKQYS
jgi:predicted DNA-binding transcriptional regulator YafY